MKAAVLHEVASAPVYGDFPDPTIENDQQELITVTAASIKQLDLLKASGKHYTRYASLPAVVGVDGVGRLSNGQRIYAAGITGMIAEKALVAKNKWVVLPDEIEDDIAAALPNALMGADMALLYRAAIKQGDNVLVNGATGIAGTVAVQLAKYHGANKVIATGRNKTTLQKLKELGADETVSLAQDDEAIAKQLAEIINDTPISIVLDYLWGHPIELILTALKHVKNLSDTKIVTVGEMAGATVSLESGIFRSKNIQLIGSGIGSLSPADMGSYLKNNMADMFVLAAQGKLKIDVEPVILKDVETAWMRAAHSSKRIVVKM